ncbi:cysteine/serine-rich nuclear protein 1 [Erythrolamprus reginae]|uniref:cysteine/serine-rich nuclear protein 1 n=1 Tax=Erythrolamprus reginae TaxID=121349 RepID=UPI00396C5D17
MTEKMLKRKHDELEDNVSDISSSSWSSFSSSLALSGWESDEETSQGGIRPSVALNMDYTPVSILKKSKGLKKNSVEFDRVTVYYFQRCQGFTAVPSSGGCTLGMASRHSYSREFTISEFWEQQQIDRYEKLKEMVLEEKLSALKQKLTKNGTVYSEEAMNLTIDDILVDDVDLINLDASSSFLMPYSAKKRRVLLKEMGVKTIDREEKYQLQKIRHSRKNCGCQCQEFCDSESCSCSLAGIKCQGNLTAFPCQCTKDCCGNIEGRIEFNPSRVQTHFMHTLMRLEMEEKQQSDDGDVESEESFQDHHHQPPDQPVNEADYEESDVSEMPGLEFSAVLETASENSCSSSMTDSSASSSESVDSEGLFETSVESPSGSEENGLAQIRHYYNSDEEEESSSFDQCQDNLSYFQPLDFFSMEVENQYAFSPVVETGYSLGYLTKIGELDENANQGPSGIYEQFYAGRNEESDNYSPFSFGELDSRNHMDLSISSNSLDLSQSSSDYNLGPLYNSLKEYVDNFTVLQLQASNQPSLGAPADQNSFLESLIGSSEPVPEISAPSSDNQFSEDAIKSSLEQSTED